MLNLNPFARNKNATPSPETKQNTVLDLMDDPKFVDFLETSKPDYDYKGLDLNAPISESEHHELLLRLERYSTQEKVIASVLNQVSGQFRDVTGGALDMKMELPSELPIQDRITSFAAELTGMTPDQVPPSLIAAIQARLAAYAPGDSEEDLLNGVREDIKAADELRGKATTALTEYQKATGIDSLAVIPDPDEAVNQRNVQNKLDDLDLKLNDATVYAQIPSEVLADPTYKAMLESYRQKTIDAVTLVRDEVGPSANSLDLIKKLGDSHAKLLDDDGKGGVMVEMNKLVEGSKALTGSVHDVLLAPRTVGDQFEAIRAQIREAALLDSPEYHTLRENVLRFQENNEMLRKLRDAAKSAFGSADGVVREGGEDQVASRRDMLDLYRRQRGPAGLFSPVMRLVSKNFRKMEKDNAGKGGKKLREEIATFEAQLSLGQNEIEVRDEARAAGKAMRDDLSALGGLSDMLQDAFHRTIEAKATDASDLREIDTLFGRGLAGTEIGTLFEEVQTNEIRDALDSSARRLFRKQVYDALDGDGKRLKPVVTGITNFLRRKGGLNGLSGDDLDTLVRNELTSLQTEVLASGDADKQRKANLIGALISTTY